jgi:hypothetical protein
MVNKQLLDLAHSCIIHEQPGSFDIQYKKEQLLSEMVNKQLLQLAHSCLIHEKLGSFEHSIRYKIEQLLSGNG